MTIGPVLRLAAAVRPETLRQEILERMGVSPCGGLGGEFPAVHPDDNLCVSLLQVEPEQGKGTDGTEFSF